MESFSPFKPIADVSRALFMTLGAGAVTFIEFLDRPIAIDGLRRDHEAEKPRPRQNHPLSQIPKRLVHKAPPMKAFRFLATIDGQERAVTVVVDLGQRRIDTGRTSSELLTREQHTGSAGIVGGGIVLLFGAITIPTMAVNHWARRRQERAEGMSWHGSSFLKAAKPLLSPEEYDLIAEAFRNTWAHAKKLSADITPDEARKLLCGSELTIEWTPLDKAETPPPVDGRPRIAVHAPVTSRYEHRTWRNPDGDLVAECRIVRLRDGTIMDQSGEEPILYVLGSSFTEEFHQLYLGNARCTERRIDDEDPDAGASLPLLIKTAPSGLLSFSRIRCSSPG